MKRLLYLACIVPVLSAQAQDFDTEAMVTAHNQARKTVGVPPLSYSPELAVSAQAWANELMQNNQCKMRHSKPDGKYGENLYWASAVQWSDGKRELQQAFPQKVVSSWANERADYDYKTNSCIAGKMCGHYTQVVWNTTTTVGCAVAVCADSKEQVWVCQYQPAGNWIGKKPY